MVDNVHAVQYNSTRGIVTTQWNVHSVGKHMVEKRTAFGKKYAKPGREIHFAAKCKAKQDQRWMKNVSTIATEYVSDKYVGITCSGDRLRQRCRPRDNKG